MERLWFLRALRATLSFLYSHVLHRAHFAVLERETVSINGELVSCDKPSCLKLDDSVLGERVCSPDIQSICVVRLEASVL